MWRRVLYTSLPAALVVGFTSIAHAQSKAAKIAQAMAAGPASITKDATIMDWPDKNGKTETLRAGSNGWTCFPSAKQTRYVKNTSVCADQSFMELQRGIMQQRPPKISQVGYAYMLTTDAWGSNTDMMANGPTAENEWHHQGPHVMIVYPDATSLAGLPTKPSKMGPYVMAAGTPYAHVMWPVK